jgi:SAM-dependent methyltransferase
VSVPDLWETYNRSASAYRSVRPAYPVAVFEAIEEYAQLPAAPRVLEVGVGTGQATRALAERGWSVLGLEPGRDLVAIARRDLAGFPNIEIQTCSFEAASTTDHSFDLVAAATSRHWVDPVVGYPKAHRVLHENGTIALWWNAHVSDTSDARWSPIRAVYEQVAPELATLARLTPDRPDYDPAAELAASALFRDIDEQSFGFSLEYSTDAFLALLDTYASHQRLDVDRRTALYERLAATIDDDLDGIVTKPYEAVLVLARPTTSVGVP